MLDDLVGLVEGHLLAHVIPVEEVARPVVVVDLIIVLALLDVRMLVRHCAAVLVNPYLVLINEHLHVLGHLPILLHHLIVDLLMSLKKVPLFFFFDLALHHGVDLQLVEV